MTRITLWLLTCAAAVWMPAAAAAGAMRCDGRIIDAGTLQVEVLGACGEPAYRDPWAVRARNRDAYFADEEEWTYNFGSNQLLRIVRLRNGKVAQIEADGYGFDRLPQPPCDPLDIVTGLSKFRLVTACGEPATRKAAQVYAPLQSRGRVYPDLLQPVYREEWIYNFGSSYLLRIVTLENGRVSDVQNGDRGFD